MLARLANNLFWMGRYVERSEHLTRYIKTQYLTSLDAPIVQKRVSALSSVYRFADMPEPAPESDENTLLTQVMLDDKVAGSVSFNIAYARENARGTRDLLSTELWETINTYHHFIKQARKQSMAERDWLTFSQQIVNYCTVIRGSIAGTLLHDSAWAFIQIGLNLERAIQVAQILHTKLNDLKRLEDNDSPSLRSFHFYSLLTACEGSDMSRRFYRRPPNDQTVLDFLILNPHFPRSLLTSITEVQHRLEQIKPDKPFRRGAVEFRVGKLVAYLTYLTYEEIKDAPIAFLEDIQGQLYQIGDHIAETYLTY